MVDDDAVQAVDEDEDENDEERERAEERDIASEGLSPYELQRLENMRNNAKIMRGLGIEDTVLKMPRQKKSSSKPQKNRDEDTEFSDSEDDDDEDRSSCKKNKGRNGSRDMPMRKARPSPGELAEKKRRWTASGKSSKVSEKGKKGKENKTEQEGAGQEELLGRKVKIEVYTEDLGANAWHLAEIIHYRSVACKRGSTAWCTART